MTSLFVMPYDLKDHNGDFQSFYPYVQPQMPTLPTQSQVLPQNTDYSENFPSIEEIARTQFPGAIRKERKVTFYDPDNNTVVIEVINLPDEIMYTGIMNMAVTPLLAYSLSLDGSRLNNISQDRYPGSPDHENLQKLKQASIYLTHHPVIYQSFQPSNTTNFSLDENKHSVELSELLPYNIINELDGIKDINLLKAKIYELILNTDYFKNLNEDQQIHYHELRFTVKGDYPFFEESDDSDDNN